MIAAGSLRLSVTIEEVTETNTDGVVAQSWSDYADNVRAGILPQSGREFYRAKQVYADMTHLVRIRYLAGVTPKMRLKLGSRYLNIVSVGNVEERDRVLDLVCIEDL